MFKTIVLLISITSGTIAFAQPNIYQFDAIDTRNGLSNNQINTIFKDEKGFMWFGTMAGLNRYDGYNFKIFRHKIGDSTSINDDYITQIMPGPSHTLWIYTPNGWNIFDPHTEKFTSHLQKYLNAIGLPDDNFTRVVPDKKNNYWFVYPDAGLYKYNATINKTTFYNSTNKYYPLHSNNVVFLALDHTGYIWIAYSDGIIEKRDGTDNKLLFTTSVLQQYAENKSIDYRLYIDADNDIWIYCTGKIKGIYYYNTSANTLLPINKDSKTIHLNHDIIRGITQDDNGNIWVASDHGGVNLIDKKKFTVSYLLNNENDNKSISQNSVNTIYKDNNGIVWLGTFKKGLNYFHENSLKFPLYQHRSNNMLYNDVNRFVEVIYG